MCLVNQRDPIQTAKLVASIDQVSAGRFLFGVGNGWNREEMEDHGTAFATRHKLSRERVEAMQAIWTQETAEYHGEFVNFDPMMAWPKPVQKPHPPVIVGGAFPQAARRAIRYGNGWIPRADRIGELSQVLAKFRADGDGGGARSGDAADHAVPRAGGPGIPARLPRTGRVARGVQPAGGKGGRAAADHGPVECAAKAVWLIEAP